MKRRVSRSRPARRVRLRVGGGVLAALDRAAGRDGVTRAGFLRAALREHAARLGVTAPPPATKLR